MANKPIFRFVIHGYVEVTADTLEIAREKLKNEFGHTKTFCTHEKDIFSYGTSGDFTEALYEVELED